MRRRSGVILVAFALSMLPLHVATPVYALDQGSCNSDFGKKAPVLLVHGFRSNPTIWGDPGDERGMRATLNEDKELFVDVFNYQAVNTLWVTDPAIGPTLARRIDCLAQASVKNGGSGKVNVVAHSMGGLATQYAANQTIDGRKLADEIKQVITIATPYKGSAMSNFSNVGVSELCRSTISGTGYEGYRDCKQTGAVRALSMGSKELKELPDFPNSVPVKVIAGDVTAYNVLLFALVAIKTNSDLIVSVDSATGKSRADDKQIVACNGLTFVGEFATNADCAHSALLSNKTVIQSVVESIDASIGKKSPPTATPTVFDAMKYTLPPGWRQEVVPGKSMSLGPPGQLLCPSMRVWNFRSQDIEPVLPGIDMIKAAVAGSCTMPLCRIQSLLS